MGQTCDARRLPMTGNQRLKIARTINCILTTIPESASVILEAMSEHIQTYWGEQTDVRIVASELLLTADKLSDLENTDF